MYGMYFLFVVLLHCNLLQLTLVEGLLLLFPYIHTYTTCVIFNKCIQMLKGNAAYFFIFFIMDENNALSEYNKIPLGHNRTNGAVYSKIYFKVDICSAH